MTVNMTIAKVLAGTSKNNSQKHCTSMNNEWKFGSNRKADETNTTGRESIYNENMTRNNVLSI